MIKNQQDPGHTQYTWKPCTGLSESTEQIEELKKLKTERLVPILGARSAGANQKAGINAVTSMNRKKAKLTEALHQEPVGKTFLMTGFALVVVLGRRSSPK